MKKYDPRLWIGALLVFGGVLVLLENLNILSDVSDIFWGAIWGLIGLFFLFMLLRNRSSWWAAFPAFTLLGLAASAFLPNSLEAFSGLVFFAGICIAFLWVYFTDVQSHWWAIIPFGILLTLGAIDALEETTGADSGNFLFLGLGLTFILVAILPGGKNRSWAFIPGLVLLVFGAFLTAGVVGWMQYLWPAALILVGGYFVLKFFRSPA
ncbi:MAG: hypothetical protein IT313_07145 [Anaerolineales bacterium]|nr:hypothetical protein [Anaerolineales bacterium]